MIEPAVDGTLRFWLYSARDGGRRSPILASDGYWSCIIFDGANNWDALIWLNGSGLELETSYVRSVTFLSPAAAGDALCPGIPLKLRELGIVGEGEILENFHR